MLWARMVAYVTGTVNQELLLRNEYLGAENRILGRQIKGRQLLSEGEKATILLVGVAIPWHRWSIEIIERHEEPHRGAVFGDQVLQHEEFDVPPEVLEQREKIAVPRQRLTEWAALNEVVPADALEREIEPVRDLPTEPAP